MFVCESTIQSHCIGTIVEAFSDATELGNYVNTCALDIHLLFYFFDLPTKLLVIIF